MSLYNVTLIDTVSIQKYIFSSNRLSENIGASELVENLIRDWTIESLPKPHNIDNFKEPIEGSHLLTDDNLNSEVIYTGGGRVALLFRDRAMQQSFLERLSIKTLLNAPGLEFIHAESAYEVDQSLAAVVGDVSRKLDEKKQERTPNMPFPGLGITAECTSTGLPAAVLKREQGTQGTARLVSAEVDSKLDRARSANERLKGTLDGFGQGGVYSIPSQFDDLSPMRGENSYLGVVHADGDSVGLRIIEIAEHFKKRGNTLEAAIEYIVAMRKFSKSIEVASSAALNACAELIWRNLDSKTLSVLAGQIDIQWDELSMPAKLPFLPFRPIVFGGDDITFVCNGQIAIALAAQYLEEFARHKIQVPDGEAELSASAGVAVVKLHYPFARAYELSEELCKNAKKLKRTRKLGPVASIDWHISSTGLVGGIDLIRDREYVSDDGQVLNIRPLTLNSVPAEKSPQTLQQMRSILSTFKGDEWKEHRNKLIGLREILREGKAATATFLKHAKTIPDLPAVDDMKGVEDEGWLNGSCPYFDAIEALDFSVLLEEAIDEH